MRIGPAALFFSAVCLVAGVQPAQAQFEAFLHEATSSNTFLFATEIDHPDLNGNPNALFSVTQVFNPQGALSGVENNAFIGVRYGSSSEK